MALATRWWEEWLRYGSWFPPTDRRHRRLMFHVAAVPWQQWRRQQQYRLVRLVVTLREPNSSSITRMKAASRSNVKSWISIASHGGEIRWRRRRRRHARRAMQSTSGVGRVNIMGTKAWLLTLPSIYCILSHILHTYMEAATTVSFLLCSVQLWAEFVFNTHFIIF